MLPLRRVASGSRSHSEKEEDGMVSAFVRELAAVASRGNSAMPDFREAAGWDTVARSEESKKLSRDSQIELVECVLVRVRFAPGATGAGHCGSAVQRQ
jgi:hypothetical protein